MDDLPLVHVFVFLPNLAIFHKHRRESNPDDGTKRRSSILIGTTGLFRPPPHYSRPQLNAAGATPLRNGEKYMDSGERLRFDSQS